MKKLCFLADIRLNSYDFFVDLLQATSYQHLNNYGKPQQGVPPARELFSSLLLKAAKRAIQLKQLMKELRTRREIAAKTYP